MDLENFSAKTIESIYQDFRAMLFISNLPTMTEIWRDSEPIAAENGFYA